MTSKSINGALEKAKDSVKQVETEVEKEITDFKLKNGKIVVPVVLDKDDLDNLKTKVEDTIDLVNDKIKNHPIEVSVQYVSGFKTKKRQELLDQLQNQINELEDGEVKAQLTSIHENLSNRILKDLSIEVHTNIDETEDSIKNAIKNIRDALEKPPFEIRPEVIVEEEQRKKIQDELDKFSKDMSFDVVDRTKQMTDSITKALDPQGISNWLDALNKGLEKLTNDLRALQSVANGDSDDVTKDVISQKEAELRIKNVQLSLKSMINNITELLANNPIPIGITPDFDPNNFIDQIKSKLNGLSVQVDAVIGGLTGGSGGGTPIIINGNGGGGWMSTQDTSAATAIFGEIRGIVDQLISSEHGFDLRRQETIKTLNTIVDKYQDYWKAGGRKSFYELGGENAAISEKLAQYYEKLL